MSRSAGGHDDGYWPSYVDVLVNVVLNLMFLAAILVVGNFFQGLEASKMVIAPDAGQQGRVLFEQEAPSASRRPLPQPFAAPDLGLEQLSMRFDGNAVQIDEQALARLKEELQAQMGRGVRYWEVFIEADVDDGLQRRAAYLRMMAVRNVFLEIGIDAQRFTLRMQPAPVSGVGGQVAYIVPRLELPGKNTSGPLPEVNRGAKAGSGGL